MCISVLVYDWWLLVYSVVGYCVAGLFVPVIVVVVVVSMVCVWFGFEFWFGVVKLVGFAAWFA